MTQDIAWLTEARSAFEWFLGRNDLGQDLYDPATGGCCDGLQEDRINRNQGAESTLAFLVSLAEMQQWMNPGPGPLFKVTLHHAGDGDRVEIATDDNLTPEALAELKKRIARLERLELPQQPQLAAERDQHAGRRAQQGWAARGLLGGRW